MNFKPAHLCFGIVFLTALASLFYSPSQNAISASPQIEEAAEADPTEVDPASTEEAAVESEVSDDTVVVLATSSVVPESEEAEATSESEPEAEFIQTNTSIVSIAKSEISRDEWQVVESELAEFYIQKNSSVPDSISQ